MQTHMRVARPSDNLNALLPFYCNGLGFEIIASFQDHDEFDGIMLGHPGWAYHLEFTHSHSHQAGKAPGQENLLVFYLEEHESWLIAIERMRACGFDPVTSLNPYWELHGKTFQDPDGYRVVLQNSSWSIAQNL